MSYTPGDTFKIRFATHEPDRGERKDAASLPSATLIRNGDNTAESVTVDNVATGDYSAAGTIPAGWDAGDEIALKIEATVQESDEETNITANRMIDLGVLDKRTSALNDFDPAGDEVANVGTVATLTGHTPQTGDTFAQLPTNFSSLGINASGHVQRVVLVDTTTANTDMRGTDDALLAASAPANFGDLAITENTGEVTAGNIVSEPLDASGIRSAVGLASANLDTQLSGIADQTDQLTFDGDHVQADMRKLNGALTDGSPSGEFRPALFLRHLQIVNSSGHGVQFGSVASGSHGLFVSSLTGDGLRLQGANSLNFQSGDIAGLDKSAELNDIITGATVIRADDRDGEIIAKPGDAMTLAPHTRTWTNQQTNESATVEITEP